MLAIVTAATKSYLHVWPQMLRSIAAAASHHAEAHFIFVTDTSEESKHAEEAARSELPEGWRITCIRHSMDVDFKDYEKTAQIRIARLQGAGFSFARSKVRADLCWSVESDNLVPANALRVLEWTLQMPTADGTPYYDVAAGTYWNGQFLGGFGTPQNPIAEDFLPKEKKLPRRLKFLWEECERRLKQENPVNVKKEQDRMQRLHERVKKYGPDGSLWAVTEKHGWRRRGWMDAAYPGIGEGAVVPSDWCGLGCTLLSKRALALADFNGYDGGGTQDLFLCWRRWHPAGLRIACVPHVVCDHVKRDGDKVVHHRGYHELHPEFRGHLRIAHQEWVPL